MFNSISSFCNLTFTQVAPTTVATFQFAEADAVNYTNDPTVALHVGNHTITTAESNPPELAYGGYPPLAAPTAQGDAWFNHTGYNNPALGTYDFADGIMHETGHNLGLKHGHAAQSGHGTTFPTLPYDHDSYEYSVMTYRQYVGDNPANSDNAPEHPTTYMQDDLAALQYLYGANYNTNNGSTVYTWDPATGQSFINGVGQGSPISNFILMTVWDGGGIDRYDFSNYATNLTVDLRPGAWTTTSTDQLANLGDGHFARGCISNSLLYQGNVASLIEDATGGSGNDTFTGNQANNTIVGGSGADTMNFSSALSNYTVVRNGMQTTVQARSGSDGVDHLVSVETLNFTDTQIGNLFFTGDLNGDGRDDILLQNHGATAVWEMNGSSIIGGGGIGALGSGWFEVGAGNFNSAAGATSDLLLQNGQQLALWEMNGVSIIGGGGIGVLNAGWSVTGVADFNHDSNSDILLQNGQHLAVWEMNGTTMLAGSGDIGTLNNGWAVAGTGDFNNDGSNDILLQNGQQLAVWEMNGTTMLAGSGDIGTLNNGWMVAGVCDVNNDGRSDILLQNGQQLAVWEMNGNSIIGGGGIGVLNPGWSLAGNGDFNNDGYSDLLLRNGQQLAEWQLHGTSIQPGSGGVGVLGSGWSLV